MSPDDKSVPLKPAKSALGTAKCAFFRDVDLAWADSGDKAWLAEVSERLWGRVVQGASAQAA